MVRDFWDLQLFNSSLRGLDWKPRVLFVLLLLPGSLLIVLLQVPTRCPVEKFRLRSRVTDQR